MLGRAVIEYDRHFLLAHEINAPNTFLPGGHLEPGETMEQCLNRELLEEVGLTAEVGAYLGAVEHMWGEPTEFEINHCFEIDSFPLDRHEPVISRESHLEFLWVHEDDLEAQNLMPPPLIGLLRGWKRGNSETWWKSTLG
jgi:8-oxo-dGTP pyrophosphatase MutT (NUDIX family)